MIRSVHIAARRLGRVWAASLITRCAWIITGAVFLQRVRIERAGPKRIFYNIPINQLLNLPSWSVSDVRIPRIRVHGCPRSILSRCHISSMRSTRPSFVQRSL